jgi:hypothetical protein
MATAGPARAPFQAVKEIAEGLPALTFIQSSVSCKFADIFFDIPEGRRGKRPQIRLFHLIAVCAEFQSSTGTL